MTADEEFGLVCREVFQRDALLRRLEWPAEDYTKSYEIRLVFFAALIGVEALDRFREQCEKFL